MTWENKYISNIIQWWIFGTILDEIGQIYRWVDRYLLIHLCGHNTYTMTIITYTMNNNLDIKYEVDWGLSISKLVEYRYYMWIKRRKKGKTSTVKRYTYKVHI